MVLYLIGGAPRCGKTALGQSLARERGIGWLSTDTVRDVVNLAMPTLYESGGPGVAPDAEADLFFPFFERTVESVAYLVDDYLIEGVGFMPRHVTALSDAIDRRVVFVGMVEPVLDQILEHEGRNRWHRDLDPRTLAKVPQWIAEWSQTLRSECGATGLAYVDLSGDFQTAQRHAATLLRADAPR